MNKTPDDFYIELKYGKPELTQTWLSTLPLEVVMEVAASGRNFHNGPLGAERATDDAILKNIIRVLIEYEHAG